MYETQQKTFDEENEAEIDVIDYHNQRKKNMYLNNIIDNSQRKQMHKIRMKFVK